MALDVVYRFRSIDKLIGKKELERNEMRLASPSELNDPMEGYKDVVWHGDPVLWENLLRHYVLMLLSCTMDCLVLGGGSSDEPEIRAELTEDGLPTDVFRRLYGDACDEFFKRPDISPLVTQLTDLKLRRDGVTLLLGLVHQAVFAIVLLVMKRTGIFPPGLLELPLRDEHLNDTLSAFRNASLIEGEEFETVAFAANRVREEQSLRALVKFDKLNAEGARRLRYLLYMFPELYVQSEPAPSWWTSRKGLFSSEFRQCSRENHIQIHSRKTPFAA